jgi:hypothetical protein
MLIKSARAASGCCSGCGSALALKLPFSRMLSAATAAGREAASLRAMVLAKFLCNVRR